MPVDNTKATLSTNEMCLSLLAVTAYRSDFSAFDSDLPPQWLIFSNIDICSDLLSLSVISNAFGSDLPHLGVILTHLTVVCRPWV